MSQASAESYAENAYQAYDYVSAEQVRPRNDNVLIRWEEFPDTTPSGLVALPKTGNARAIDGRAAIVVAAGNGVAFASTCEQCGRPKNPYPLEVKPGDRVIVDGSLVGERVYVNGVEHRLVRQAELMAVVE